jgi:hypothetical protein
MASLRGIKKDIDYLVGEVVSDCYTYLYLNGDKNRDKVVEIIEGVVAKRNDFIRRVNNPAKGADRKQTRKHYKQIYSDLLGSVDESFSQLSQLVG